MAGIPCAEGASNGTNFPIFNGTNASLGAGWQRSLFALSYGAVFALGLAGSALSLALLCRTAKPFSLSSAILLHLALLDTLFLWVLPLHVLSQLRGAAGSLGRAGCGLSAAAFPAHAALSAVLLGSLMVGLCLALLHPLGSLRLRAALLGSLRAEQRPLSSVPLRTEQRPLSSVPLRAEQRPLSSVPLRAEQRPLSSLSLRTEQRPLSSVPLRTEQRPLSSVPLRTEQRPLSSLSLRTEQPPLSSVPLRTEQRPLSSVPLRTEQRPFSSLRLRAALRAALLPAALWLPPLGAFVPLALHNTDGTGCFGHSAASTAPHAVLALVFGFVLPFSAVLLALPLAAWSSWRSGRRAGRRKALGTVAIALGICALCFVPHQLCQLLLFLLRSGFMPPEPLLGLMPAIQSVTAALSSLSCCLNPVLCWFHCSDGRWRCPCSLRLRRRSQRVFTICDRNFGDPSWGSKPQQRRGRKNLRDGVDSRSTTELIVPTIS